jgi:hypothetical protein
MLSLLHEETGFASNTVLAPPREGAAAAVRREDEATPRAQRRTLAALTEALAATRRGFGD